jgi:hypothetical protein
MLSHSYRWSRRGCSRRWQQLCQRPRWRPRTNRRDAYKRKAGAARPGFENFSRNSVGANNRRLRACRVRTLGIGQSGQQAPDSCDVGVWAQGQAGANAVRRLEALFGLPAGSGEAGERLGVAV